MSKHKTIKLDVTDIPRHEWEYRSNKRTGRVYRQNTFVEVLRRAGIPAYGIKSFRGVITGEYKIEINDNDRMFIVWNPVYKRRC